MNGKNQEERLALYLLNEIDGMHRLILLRMRSYAGSFSEAYRVPAEDYRKLGLFGNGAGAERRLHAYDRRREREEEKIRALEQYEADGVRVVTVYDEDFPKRLRHSENHPLLLYVRGSLPDENTPTASVIGARMCSDYGRDTARYFAEELAEAGVQIVSGMAAGIDGTAQAGALARGHASFAVLGSGVNVCYPAENRAIYQRMAGGLGGVLSEYPPDSAPLPYRFVLRNRIIAALGDVLLVLEAREKSGTSITVSDALDLGKEVFALPGRIDDPLGRGCNALLRDGASILTGPEDVLECLHMTAPAVSLAKEKRFPVLAKDEKIVYSWLDSAPRHVEMIASRAGMPIAQTADLLLRLELAGVCASPMSGYYRKTR